MTKADLIYNEVVEETLMNGIWNTGEDVRTKWEDGTPAYTKAILNVQMKFDNGDEIPILSSKKAPRKDPIQEVFWIWRDKSNDVGYLRETLGCKVWNEWEQKDGTIGKAYGWQLRHKKRKVPVTTLLIDMIEKKELEAKYDGVSDYVELDQVDYLIYTLRYNPHSRRIKTTLWCVEDLDDMALEPCAYETHWQVLGGKLHLTVNIRSNDAGLGNPYNTYQYAVLHRMIAQVTGLEVGTICFNIDNFHIYDRHVDALTEQIKLPTYAAPTFWLNPEIKSFYDFRIEDIRIENYESGPSIPMEVAI